MEGADRYTTTEIKEAQSIVGNNELPQQFLPATVEACDPLQRLTSVKSEWTWNRSYQYLFDKAKTMIKEECMYEVLKWNMTTTFRNRWI